MVSFKFLLNEKLKLVNKDRLELLNIAMAPHAKGVYKALEANYSKSSQDDKPVDSAIIKRDRERFRSSLKNNG